MTFISIILETKKNKKYIFYMYNNRHTLMLFYFFHQFYKIQYIVIILFNIVSLELCIHMLFIYCNPGT